MTYASNPAGIEITKLKTNPRFGSRLLLNRGGCSKTSKRLLTGKVKFVLGRWNPPGTSLLGGGGGG
jgi:hypothetical protein